MSLRVLRRTIVVSSICSVFIILSVAAVTGTVGEVTEHTITPARDEVGVLDTDPMGDLTRLRTHGTTHQHEGYSQNAFKSATETQSLQRWKYSHVLVEKSGQNNPTTNTSNEQDGSSIVVTGLSANKTIAEVEEPITVSATVKNVGSDQATEVVTIVSIGDNTTETVVLEPNESTTVTRIAQYPTPGNYTITAGDREIQVQIIPDDGSATGSDYKETTTPGMTVTSSPSSVEKPKFEIVAFETSNRTVNINETVVIEAAIENTGDAPGTFQVVFRNKGEVTQTRELQLAPAESTVVSFEVSYGSPGIYTASINGREVTILVKRGLDRGTGIEVGEITGTPGDSVTSAAGENSSEQSQFEGNPNSSSSGEVAQSSDSGIPWFYIGIGCIGLLGIGFVTLEVYARRFR